jgi:hypothetical protein
MKDLQTGKKLCFLKRFPSQSRSQKAIRRQKEKFKYQKLIKKGLIKGYAKSDGNTGS